MVTRDIAASGIPPETTVIGQTHRDPIDGSFEQVQANLGDQLLLDVVVSLVSKPETTREVKKDDADFGKKHDDADFDPIRDDPSLAEIMKPGFPDRRYTAVWNTDASFESIPIYGVDPASQLKQCRDLIAHGYRPVSLTLTRATSDGPLATASVWHRPVVSEEVKDRLAERQARAAVALVRMGKAEHVWPLLRHRADPRVRVSSSTGCIPSVPIRI